MSNPSQTGASAPLVLAAVSARDLMEPNPVSISDKATVKESIAFLSEKGFSAAPVIDDAGRPVGVVSKTDIVIHAREKVEYVPPAPEYFEKSSLATSEGEALKSGFQVENVDNTSVRDIMTPTVFTVAPETPVRKVIEQILALKVHRMFVVDSAGVLIGVISAVDVLRHLR